MAADVTERKPGEECGLVGFSAHKASVPEISLSLSPGGSWEPEVKVQ